MCFNESSFYHRRIYVFQNSYRPIEPLCSNTLPEILRSFVPSNRNATVRTKYWRQCSLSEASSKVLTQNQECMVLPLVRHKPNSMKKIGYNLIGNFNKQKIKVLTHSIKTRSVVRYPTPFALTKIPLTPKDCPPNHHPSTCHPTLPSPPQSSW